MSVGASMLGLPPPNTIQLSDRALVRAYRAFVATLRPLGDTAVICDSEFFSGVVRTPQKGSGSTTESPRLKLLAALVSPGPAQMAAIRQRTFAVDDFDRQYGQFTGHRYEAIIARALRSFQDSAASAECHVLRAGRSPGRVLGGITCHLAQAPGMTSVYELEVSTFGEEWALVLTYDDAEDLQEAAFPRIFGFGARADLPWSAAAVVAHDPFGTPPPTVAESSGLSAFDEQLFALCWSRDDDGVSWGQYLLELPRDETAKLLGECAGVGYRNIFAKFADAYFYLDDEDEEIPGQSESDLFQRVARIRATREQEEETRTRLSRGLAFLTTIGRDPNLADEDLVQRVARQFEGVPGGSAREILTEGLRDQTAARGSVAVATLRLNLRSADDLLPEPRTAATGLAHGLARRARAVLSKILSEDEARELLQKATSRRTPGTAG